MDREEFKLRMKSLKSYRELNPGKGYWDWKVEAFTQGGITDNDTDKEELFRRQRESEKRLYDAKHPTQERLLEVKLNADKIDSDLSLIQTAMNDAVKPTLSADKVKQHAEDKVEKSKDKLYPYKLLGNSLATAAELASAYYILGKGAKTLGWLPKSKVIDDLYASDTPLIFANSLGATADGYLLITADNKHEKIENSIELPMDVAGIIGGTNWFRRIPGIPTRIDDVLDWMGYSAAAYDGIIKPSVKGVFNITKPIEEL